MIINEKEAEIVRFIFEKYLERKSLSEVALLCRENKYKGKRGAEFTPQSVLVVLTRFVYCGYYNWHNMPIKGEFEPIITIQTFNKVQSILKSQGKLTGRKEMEN